MSEPLTRAEIEEFWDSWLAANRHAEEVRDWTVLADFYAVEATYGWMYSPDEHFMAIGRDQIGEWAMGLEMAGLDGWHYDYQATMIDEKNAMALGFWKQRSGIAKDDADPSQGQYEILGIGGSWFGVERQSDGPDAGLLKFAWQRDWFDLGSAATTFLEIAGAGKASPGLLARMSLNGIDQPGHYRLRDLPSTVWPPPVERGDFLTQEAAR